MRNLLLFLAVILIAADTTPRAKDVPVPATCTPEVNAVLTDIVRHGSSRQVYNVMVCGTAAAPTAYFVSQDAQGYRHATEIAAPLTDGTTARIKVLTNDRRDGVVLAKTGDRIIVFGWYNQPYPWEHVDGVINNAFCAIHPDLYNGWVVVNGKRWPTGGC